MSRSGRLGPDVLFCPASRPDRFGKALSAARTVVLDLEDGVDADDKAQARREVVLALARIERGRCVVRINGTSSPWHEEDVVALRAAGAKLVMLPKAERSEDVGRLAPMGVIPLCETARGVLAAPALADEGNTIALFWGAEDLMADLGGTTSRDAAGRPLPPVEHARASVLIAAAAAGKPAWDAVHLDISEDRSALALEAAEAAAMGFAAKVAIHPLQCEVIRASFAPSDEAVSDARAVIAAAKEAGGGVFALSGRMVDEPLLRQARATLARAGFESSD